MLTLTATEQTKLETALTKVHNPTYLADLVEKIYDRTMASYVEILEACKLTIDERLMDSVCIPRPVFSRQKFLAKLDLLTFLAEKQLVEEAKIENYFNDWFAYFLEAEAINPHMAEEYRFPEVFTELYLTVCKNFARFLEKIFAGNDKQAKQAKQNKTSMVTVVAAFYNFFDQTSITQKDMQNQVLECIKRKDQVSFTDMYRCWFYTVEQFQRLDAMRKAV